MKQTSPSPEPPTTNRHVPPQNPQPPTASPQTVAELGEHRLLDRIRSRVPPQPAWVTLGIGDDAAVVEPARGALEVVTTDALVEGIHFDLAFAAPADLGFKALAVNLSDLAAMGATPRLAVLSLALPDQMRVSDVEGLLDALLELAAHHRVTLVGGNVTRSPGPLFVGFTAMGSVKRRRVLSRGGARAGDELHVSGAVGAAAAGLQWLRRFGRQADQDQSVLAACRQRYLRPEPRVRLGALIGGNRAASACIDLSDGLGDAVRQIAAASGLGAVIDGAAIPVDPTARRWFEQQGVDPLVAAVQGGEDYELLFTVPRACRGRYAAVRRLGRGLPLTRIGIMTEDRALVLRRAEGDAPLPAGFDHFG